MSIVLQAEVRADMGKGASRRLRRLENKVPAIIYGGEKEPQAIHFLHHQLLKAFEDEAIYSSVFNVKVGGKNEHVILKDVQRHPYKPVILHMDLQRVSDKDVLVRMVPLHFINEQQAKGVKAGGIVNHTMMQIEIRCKAKDLPAYIEVDISPVELNETLHLSSLKLPKGVELATDPTVGDHDHPVVSIHMPRVVVEEEPVVEAQDSESTEESNAPSEEQAASEAVDSEESPE